jgi:hypothetical protein
MRHGWRHGAVTLSLGARFFIFEPDGTLRRVSHRSISQLVMGIAAIPQLSGQKIRDVQAIIEREGQTPVGLSSLRCGHLQVDGARRIDNGLEESATRPPP